MKTKNSICIRVVGSGIILALTMLSLFVLLTLVACSGSGEASSRRGLTYSANLGAATLYDINTKTRAVLDRYQFRIERIESSTDMLYIETEWKNRYPFDDEIEQGIDAALTRIIIQATPRTRSVGGDLNTVRLQAENQVRYRHGVEWHIVPMSPMLISYLKKLTEDTTIELRTGIRKY